MFFFTSPHGNLDLSIETSSLECERNLSIASIPCFNPFQVLASIDDDDRAQDNSQENTQENSQDNIQDIIQENAENIAQENTKDNIQDNATDNTKDKPTYSRDRCNQCLKSSPYLCRSCTGKKLIGLI